MVNAQHFAETLGYLFVAAKVVALAAHTAACVQRWQQVLLVQLFQNAGRTCCQIVVEQDRARVKIFQHQPPAHALYRFEREALARGQVDHRARFHFWVNRAQAHVQARHVEDALQLHQAAEVSGVVGIVLGNDQQVACFRADFLDRCHGRLHCQRQHLGRQVVPAAREQVGIDRRQFEACVADVHRGVERGRVLHPLQAKPALGGRHRVNDSLLQFIDGASEGRDEIRNHREDLPCKVFKRL